MGEFYDIEGGVTKHLDWENTEIKIDLKEEGNGNNNKRRKSAHSGMYHYSLSQNNIPPLKCR